MKITWSASGNSSYINGGGSASSVLAAIRAARNYIRNELYGVGVSVIYVDGEPMCRDERSLNTGMRWVARAL